MEINFSEDQIRVDYIGYVTDRNLRLRHKGIQVIIRESEATEERKREI